MERRHEERRWACASRLPLHMMEASRAPARSSVPVPLAQSEPANEKQTGRHDEHRDPEHQGHTGSLSSVPGGAGDFARTSL